MNIKKIVLLPILFSFTFNCVKSMQNNDNETTYHQDIKTIANDINAIYEFKKHSIKQKCQQIIPILNNQIKNIQNLLCKRLLTEKNKHQKNIFKNRVNLANSYQNKQNKQNIKQYKQNLFSIINQDNNKKQLIKNIDNNKNLLNKINEYLDFYHSTKQILIELINETSINNKTINNKNIININKTLIRQYSIIKSYKTILDFILRQYNEYKYIEDIHYGLFQMDNIND